MEIKAKTDMQQINNFHLILNAIGSTIWVRARVYVCVFGSPI